MRHPLDAIPDGQRKRIFWPLFFITLFMMGFLSWIGAPLVTPSAPSGIVSFELAGSVAQAQTILASWSQSARLSAAFSLGFDYVFMLAYSTTIALACLWAGGILVSRGWPMAWLGASLAWGQWLAALFDAIENLALTIILFGQVISPWPEIARICALIKFALVLAGMAYAIFGLIASLIRR